ncbi:MAG: hypothetical protein L7S63_09360 [Flavobacteriales bacterium]|nr:hypothetical protein [Flavobacteriales bacterium]
MRFLALIVASTAIDFAVGRRLAVTTAPGARKAWLCLSLAFNLGMLVWFKYAGFLVDQWVAAWATVGVAMDPLVLLVHPLHPEFYRQVNAQAQADCDAAMTQAAKHPRVHYLALGRDSVPHTAFRDFHHLTCEGGESVATHLAPLLAELID